MLVHLLQTHFLLVPSLPLFYAPKQMLFPANPPPPFLSLFISVLETKCYRLTNHTTLLDLLAQSDPDHRFIFPGKLDNESQSPLSLLFDSGPVEVFSLWVLLCGVSNPYPLSLLSPFFLTVIKLQDIPIRTPLPMMISLWFSFF